MMNQNPGQLAGRTAQSLPIPAIIQALGLFTVAVTVLGVLVALALRAGRDDPISTNFVLAAVGLFIGGLGLGGFLLGLGSLVRHLRHAPTPGSGAMSFPTDTTALNGTFAEAGVADAGESPGSAGADRLLALLSQPRDLANLAPDEREVARERLRNHLQREAAEIIIDSINRRQLGEARAMLRVMEVYYGSSPTIERLVAKLDEATKLREPLDYTHTRRVVEEAIVAGRWAVAESSVRALCFNHPDSNRGRQLWDETRRARLHAHIEHCAARHLWNEALAAANEFLARFPDSNEAQALRGQVGTLRANAEIHQRKQYEGRFRDLVANHQYAEALRLAQLVINRFPDSPQAQALRAQLPALERRLAG